MTKKKKGVSKASANAPSIADIVAEAKRITDAVPPTPRGTMAPMEQPPWSMSARQLEKVKQINSENKVFWERDQAHLVELSKKYTDDQAHRLMEEARLIVDEHTLKVGAHSHDAAVAAVEKIEAKRRQDVIDRRKAANDKRHAVAVKGALDEYRDWERGRREVLKGKSTDDRIALFFKTMRPKKHIKRHIRDLREAGEI